MTSSWIDGNGTVYFYKKFQAINNGNFSKKISGNGPVKNIE